MKARNWLSTSLPLSYAPVSRGLVVPRQANGVEPGEAVIGVHQHGQDAQLVPGLGAHHLALRGLRSDRASCTGEHRLNAGELG